ncbi:hypothetical protein LPA44_06400 [Halobacterium sp. KA-4]|uniref:hypothetical protein n=1 Tax=Halobacterium sp. KA-4 TaxID=2896367 RepID=UPI001E2D9C3F|nr:hypothetical protein [Halobacterium sp. KA-4]MCD2199526.1 hypothetical protein [Halobacterium sp. KA-4]
MAENHAQRWPILLVGIGLGMVVFGAQATHFANLIEFTYSVEATTQAAATEAANVSDPGVDVIYHFTDLPATAQDAFRQALEAPDNRTTIRGLEHQVTELTSASDTTAQPGHGHYYVEYQESYYEFTIRQPMNVAALSSLLGYAFAVFGVLVGVWGSFEHGSTTRALLAHLSGVGSFLAVYGVTGWWGLNTFLSLVVVGAVCASLPAVGVWTVYRTLRS